MRCGRAVQADGFHGSDAGFGAAAAEIAGVDGAAGGASNVSAGNDFGTNDAGYNEADGDLPATVNYVVDLAAMRAGDLVWDGGAQTLTVRRPAVVAMAPAIEWQKAQMYQDGGWATALTGVSDGLRKDNLEKAPGLFLRQSKDADLLALADTAADAALETAFRMPLVAAGFVDARVIVTR